jgi:hypothetical protein
MVDYLYFWLMKSAADFLIGVGIFSLIVLVYLLARVPTYLNHRRCTHKTVHEDMSCNAWCRSCGKNLGFIGTYRAKQHADKK